MPRLRRARLLAEYAPPVGRWLPHHALGEAEAYAAAGAWRECAEVLPTLSRALGAGGAGSGRVRRGLLRVLGGIVRDPGAPPWLTCLAVGVGRDVLSGGGPRHD